MPLILGTNSIKDTGYNVDNSLRFDDGSTDRLRRTPSSASNRRTFTLSTWVKRSALGSSNRSLICATVDDGNKTMLRFTDSDQLRFVRFTGGGATNQLITNALFRDVSAWYHIVMAVDTTNSTAGDRLRLYVNGSEITSFSTESQPTQNYDYDINNTEEHNIGYGTDDNNHLFDGYMAETVLVDGQQLAPDQFGEFDSDSGIWKPIDVSGLTFGTNGFYLDFEDSSALGNDAAGSNNFTVSNLTAIDQSTDTCTNNFATLNFLSRTTKGTVPTMSEGNLQAVNSSNASSNGGILATIGTNSGKWYWEAKVLNNNSGVFGIALASLSADIDTYGHTMNQTGSYGFGNSGYKWVNGSGSSDGTYAFSTNDILMCAMDLDNNFVYFGNGGTWYASGNPTSGSSGTNAFSSFTNNFYIPTMCNNSGNFASGFSFNFGSPAFAISSGNTDADGYGNFEYAVPSGYYALNTKNLAEYG